MSVTVVYPVYKTEAGVPEGVVAVLTVTPEGAQGVVQRFRGYASLVEVAKRAPKGAATPDLALARAAGLQHLTRTAAWVAVYRNTGDSPRKYAGRWVAPGEKVVLETATLPEEARLARRLARRAFRMMGGQG